MSAIQMLLGRGGGGPLYTPLALNDTVATTGSWQYFSITTTGVLVIQGGGGGGGNRSNYGAVGGEGGYVKIPVSTGDFRVWVGLGGGSAASGATVTVDGSGYGANGGAGGTGTSATTGGSGGTPTILERLSGGSWVLVAMAGAGGGGGQHTNNQGCRGAGGGTWSAHTIAGGGTDLGNSIYRGSLAGSYDGSSSTFAGRGNLSQTYIGGTNSGPGADATTLNQYFGGTGGNSTADNPGGGGGGGYGGGAGGAGGGNGGSPGPGGYIQVSSTRWGGTGGGGYNNNNAGGGGGGGGSYYDAAYSGAGELVGNAISDSVGSRSTANWGSTYRANAFVGSSYGYGGGFGQSGAQGALKFLATAPF